ncbi:hypothetical protein EON65_10075 [archaeon]|nr:MAG: hypothetical protein EON65_10075 [archaeon]
MICSPVVQSLARKYNKTTAQVFFRFVQSLGIIPLSGTTSPEHMHEDLTLSSFSLEPAEVEQINALLH